MNAFVTARRPTVFTSITILISSTETSSRGPLRDTPALLTRPDSFPPVALVRVGRLPIPSSTASLVILRDVLGVIGAIWLVTGLAFDAPSIINLVVSFMALLVLGSWVHGVLLRINCSALRIDRGVGRMLSVLSEPSLLRWHSLHIPLLSTLSLFALVRVAFVAYFRTHAG